MNKQILLFALMVTTYVSSPLIYAATSIKAEVNGMVCAFCAKGIEKKLNAMPQRQSSFVDLKSRIVVLEIKEGHSVPVEQFTKAIEDAGYSVSKVETVQQSAEELKAQVLKRKRAE